MALTVRYESGKALLEHPRDGHYDLDQLRATIFEVLRAPFGRCSAGGCL
jgi:hypothetical protein